MARCVSVLCAFGESNAQFTALSFILSLTVEIGCGQTSIESRESGYVSLHDPTVCGR